MKVVILLPGTLGSELCLNGKVIWPGHPTDFVFGYKLLEQLKDPGIIATGIIRNVSIVKQYGPLIEDLNVCGFSEFQNPPTLYPLAYDWRLSNTKAAKRLADCVDQCVKHHGTGVEIILIGHSMGGLVCRHFLESGIYSSHPGFQNVKTLITLGTPHQGAPVALIKALGKDRALFLSGPQVADLSKDPRYPSLYELFPPAGEPFVRRPTAESNLGSIPIYSQQEAGALGLDWTNLHAASSFHQTLSLAKKPEYMRYFCFAGTQEKTVASVQAADDGGKYLVSGLKRKEGGDGTVPIWSAILPGIERELTGGEHGTIFTDRILRQVLSTLLGHQGVLATSGSFVQVTVSQQVYSPDDPINLTIEFPRSTRHIHGALKVEHANPVASGEPSFRAIVSPEIMTYTGPTLDHLVIEMAPLNDPGLYRAMFEPDDRNIARGATEFFVQQPNNIVA
jgi:pimeloyl-ACP methyl ester carboxylesterase